MELTKENKVNYKTPYYEIDKNELDNNFKKLISALGANWNNYIIGYSYKTNSLPWLIKHFDDLGCYAEVVSEDEYKLAKFIGVKHNCIIYNGPIKTLESFQDALNNGCVVNIDSQREIDWLDNISFQQRKVGIRVNFDIEKLCPGSSQCQKEGGRFGFCYENGELKKAIEKLKNKHAKVIGLHLHTSSKTRGLEIYREIAKLACKLQQEFQLELEYVDVGGGFFGGLSSKPQFNDYISEIAGILSESFDKRKVKLIVEPGMSLIGAPVSYVTTVIDVKDTTYSRFVITDGSRTNIDPLMSKTSYFYSVEHAQESSIIKKQVVCGYTCMEHDRLFECTNERELCINDKIIYNKVGAYTMCLTPLFIKYFPDVYVNDNGKMEKVRNAWTEKEFMQLSTLLKEE